LIPGATNVNLAVFIGTQMRGTVGALVCFAGLTALPVGIILLAGLLYLQARNGAESAWLSGALAGMGAVAIGLNLGTGVRLALRNLRGTVQLAVTAVVTVAIGVLGLSLVHVLIVIMPLSLVATWLTSRS
jgi:chromate transporter